MERSSVWLTDFIGDLTMRPATCGTGSQVEKHYIRTAVPNLFHFVARPNVTFLFAEHPENFFFLTPSFEQGNISSGIRGPIDVSAAKQKYNNNNNNTKIFLYLIKRHAKKTYRGMEVQIHRS
jgi:hypothetical protein